MSDTSDPTGDAHRMAQLREAFAPIDAAMLRR
jgi:hypothetical protein